MIFLLRSLTPNLYMEGINKKLGIEISNDKIEKMVSLIISETDEKDFEKVGKNYLYNKSL